MVGWYHGRRETKAYHPHPMRFTIVTACRNAAATIEATLSSIDAQRVGLVELEHIVLDGGSTDETPDILRRHAAPWRTVITERDDGPADADSAGDRPRRDDACSRNEADDHGGSSAGRDRSGRA